MKLLFMDCETTGLFDYSKPADAEGQPRLASIAAVLSEDERVLTRFTAYVKPLGWTMPPEAGAINGLSTEFLMEYGIPVRVVLEWYNALLDLDPAVVAHNVRFDTKVMRGELRRMGYPDRYQTTRTFCTKGAAGNLRLSEAVKTFLGEDMVNAHQAEADMEYCRRLYWSLKNRTAVCA